MFLEIWEIFPPATGLLVDREFRLQMHMQAAGLVVGQKTKNHIYREMTGHNTNVTSDLCDTVTYLSA